MKFEEFNEEMIVLDNKIKSFVYFLIKNDEVVYVGKTEKGLVRPFSHKNKDFDFVVCVPTDVDLLDERERFLIKKYTPIYNTTFAKYKKNLTLFELTVPKIRNLYFPQNTKININKLKDFAYSNGIEKTIIKKKEYVDWEHLNNLLQLNKDKLEDLIVYKTATKTKNGSKWRLR